MGNPLPTSGADLPCALQNFTGIPAVTAQPAYSVYDYSNQTLSCDQRKSHKSGITSKRLGLK